MVLYPEAMLDDLRLLPGAEHSFLVQLARPDGAPWREWLTDALAEVDGPARARWADALRSLHNPTFFQAWAELATARVLAARGWKLTDLSWPGPNLVLRDPEGRRFTTLVLAFLRQERLADRDAVQRLCRALDRIGSRSRIVVLVRRWLPHDFDPEPVRRAIDMWLREVDRSGWEGRYAEYRDAHISLEFALTGEKARGGQRVVATALGPYDAHRTLQVMEQRVVQELDAVRLSTWNDLPVLLSLVTDQPWRLPRGYLRELFYGKPRQQTTAPPPEGYQALFDGGGGPCLFHDPIYRAVSAALLIHRAPQRVEPEPFHSYQNPWAERRVDAGALPGATFGLQSQGPDGVVMRWIPSPSPSPVPSP